jgi:hypothetical protein
MLYVPQPLHLGKACVLGYKGREGLLRRPPYREWPVEVLQLLPPAQ